MLTTSQRRVAPEVDLAVARRWQVPLGDPNRDGHRQNEVVLAEPPRVLNARRFGLAGERSQLLPKRGGELEERRNSKLGRGEGDPPQGDEVLARYHPRATSVLAGAAHRTAHHHLPHAYPAKLGLVGEAPELGEGGMPGGARVDEADGIAVFLHVREQTHEAADYVYEGSGRTLEVPNEVVH